MQLKAHTQELPSLKQVALGVTTRLGTCIEPSLIEALQLSEGSERQ